MKIVRLIPVLLLILASCASDNWKNIRPMQERLITLELKTGHFDGANNIHVDTYIIPDDESPEVRLIIVGRFNTSNARDMKNLVEAVEEAVVNVMPFGSDIPRDTSHIKIQLTGYDSSRKVMQYYRHEWKELSKTITDSELRKSAKWVQKKTAQQKGFE